jgi:hypothetical protein
MTPKLYEVLARRYPEKFHIDDTPDKDYLFQINQNGNWSFRFRLSCVKSHELIGIYLLIAEELGVKVWAGWNSLSDCWHGMYSLGDVGTDYLEEDGTYLRFDTQEQAILAALTQTVKETK